jgi:hypothetical protein
MKAFYILPLWMRLDEERTSEKMWVPLMNAPWKSALRSRCINMTGLQHHERDEIPSSLNALASLRNDPSNVLLPQVRKRFVQCVSVNTAPIRQAHIFTSTIPYALGCVWWEIKHADLTSDPS